MIKINAKKKLKKILQKNKKIINKKIFKKI